MIAFAELRNAAWVLFLCLALSAPAALAQDPFEQGEAALKAGDRKQAMQLFEQAALAGNAEAQNRYGNMVQNAGGAKVASQWFEKAAQQNHSRAQINLGVNYQNGWGVKKDKAEAYVWLSLAVENGDELAKGFLDALMKKMNKKQIADGDHRLAERRAALASPAPSH